MNIDYKQYEITTGAGFFYMTGDKPYIYADVTLEAPVDADILQRAAEFTLQRYPFFAVRITESKAGDRYILETNSAVFPVREMNGFLSCDSDAANGFLIGITYHKDHIFLSVFHGLTDGSGIKTLLNTLVCIYFKCLDQRTGEKESGIKSFCNTVNSINGIGIAPSDEEYADPYGFVREPDCSLILKKEKGFTFREDLIEQSGASVYCFSISEKAIVDYAKKDEGSVSGILAVTLARTVDLFEPLRDKPLLISCPMDMRKILGCRRTMRNCTKSTRYKYTDQLRSQLPERQLSSIKGQMILQSDECRQLGRYSQERDEFLELCGTATIEDKRKILNSGAVNGEPGISYLGKIDFGEYDGRVNDLRLYTRALGTMGMLCSCYCFHGKICICTSYTLKEEKYIRLFANELQEYSSERSGIEKIRYETPGFRETVSNFY